jgi:hypothetical protein
MSEPETISWRDALKRLIEVGYAEDTAPAMLVEAVKSNAVSYYPRRALPLGSAHLNPQTGAWPMHRQDNNAFLVRPIRLEFERWLLKLRRPPKAGSETQAIAFLSTELEADRDLKRDDAWNACRIAFPNLSKRSFISHVWPQGRKKAGLEPHARGGRKRQKQ